MYRQVSRPVFSNGGLRKCDSLGFIPDDVLRMPPPPDVLIDGVDNESDEGRRFPPSTSPPGSIDHAALSKKCPEVRRPTSLASLSPARMRNAAIAGCSTRRSLWLRSRGQPGSPGCGKKVNTFDYLFGKSGVTTKRKPQPLGPPSGVVTQQPIVPVKLKGCFPNLTSFATPA